MNYFLNIPNPNYS